MTEIHTGFCGRSRNPSGLLFNLLLSDNLLSGGLIPRHPESPTRCPSVMLKSQGGEKITLIATVCGRGRTKRAPWRLAGITSCGVAVDLTSFLPHRPPPRGAPVPASLRPELLHLVLRGALQRGPPGPPGAAADGGPAGHVLGAALRLPGGGAVRQRPLAHRLHQGGAAAVAL